ncbi:MAG: hypothetical protein ACK56I_34890, partial [bacterium]
ASLQPLLARLQHHRVAARGHQRAVQLLLVVAQRLVAPIVERGVLPHRSGVAQVPDVAVQARLGGRPLGHRHRAVVAGVSDDLLAGPILEGELHRAGMPFRQPV